MEHSNEHKDNFLESERAATETIGNVLMLSITVMAVSSILLYSVPYIQKLNDMAIVKNIEIDYALLDYRISRLALGAGSHNVMNMELGGGSLSTLSNSPDMESYMSIKSSNNTFNVVIPMGKLEYRLGDRVVAYEGGGVWSKYPDGSVMLSPPEFHYNGYTLTLPVVSITGNDSVGGKGLSKIYVKKDSISVLYPTENDNNPLDYNMSGKVYVNITSDYYDAWADYAKSLLYTKIYKYPESRTTSIELRVVPDGFGNKMSIEDPIKLRGLPEDVEPLKNFSFRFYSFNNFQEFDWDMRAKLGDKKLIFHIFKNTLRVGYQEGNKDGETWGVITYAIQSDELGQYIDVDLLDNNTYLTYSNQNVGSNNAKGCQPFGTKISGISNPDYSWNDIIINTDNTNKTQSIYNITQHYISMMDSDTDFPVLWQCSPAGKHDPEIPSTMVIDYEVIGDITYLYVSANRADMQIQ